MTAPSPLIAIFGAAVLADGRPSASLLRRIGYGQQAAEAWPDSPVCCSGGIGRAGPSEASIMAERLGQAGLPRDRLVLDEASLDTLQSCVAIARWLARHGGGEVIVCSDDYHIARIRMMLGLLHVRSRRGPVPRGPGGAPLTTWLRMSLREGLAYPYDFAVMLARRRELQALAQAAS